MTATAYFLFLLRVSSCVARDYKQSLYSILSGHSTIQERPHAMDAISNSSDPFSSTSDPKSAIIKQIRHEAALSNARQLIDVNSFLPQ